VASAAEFDDALSTSEEAGRKAAKIDLYNLINTTGICHEEWFKILGETLEANPKIAYPKGRQQLVGNSGSFSRSCKGVH
jgi:hypothetical protein